MLSPYAFLGEPETAYLSLIEELKGLRFFDAPTEWDGVHQVTATLEGEELELEISEFCEQLADGWTEPWAGYADWESATREEEA